MCKQLFLTICQSKVKIESNHEAHMVLPCLITALCKTFISDQEYNEALNEYTSVVHKEQITRGYGLSVQHDWTIEIHIEHVRHQQAEQMNDQDFWQQNNPRGLEDFIDHSCEVYRRLNTKLDKLSLGESSGAQERKRKKRR